MGERVGQPEFGSRIRELCFEQIDDELPVRIEEEVRRTVSNWLPYINVQEVNTLNEEGDENKIFVQVNIGDELQKAGVSPNEVENFKNKCVEELNLNIIGLMCLPPKNKIASIYFKEMNQLLIKTNLKELSMGMSNDYIEAIDNNSSYVRIGSKIFGSRGH